MIVAARPGLIMIAGVLLIGLIRGDSRAFDDPPEARYEPTDRYETRQIEGWTILVNKRFVVDQPELAESRRRAVLATLASAGVAMPAERVLIGPSLYPGLAGVEAINNYGNTGKTDNVLYGLGFSTSRKGARQLIAHGNVFVNGRRCDIPSKQVRSGDRIGLTPKREKVRSSVTIFLTRVKPCNVCWIKSLVSPARKSRSACWRMLSRAALLSAGSPRRAKLSKLS